MRLAIVLEDMETGNFHLIEYGTPGQERAMAWARFHGLDPNMILGASTITRDPAGRRIIYERMVTDPPGSRDVRDIVVRDEQAVTEVVVEQGEAPPLPFNDPRFDTRR